MNRIARHITTRRLLSKVVVTPFHSAIAPSVHHMTCYKHKSSIAAPHMMQQRRNYADDSDAYADEQDGPVMNDSYVSLLLCFFIYINKLRTK